MVVVQSIIKKETTTTKKKSNFFATEATVFFQSGINRTRLKRGAFVARACKAERRMMMNWKNRFCVKVISNSILSKTKRAFVEKESPRMRGPPNDNNTTVGVEEDDEEQKEAPRRHRA